ncbi:MAG: tyrosine-type recombinase/integrase [Oligoflexia bacterium]|nr:tyrosine-type recombinase/integrase [Oligoflexia bacterium]
MALQKKKWAITSDKFLTLEQVEALKNHLTSRRDLAIARGNDPQAIRDYYTIRAMLETGLRVSEFCDLLNEDLNGTKLNVKLGKGGKPRTILLTRSTLQFFKEWQTVKARLGHDLSPQAPFFPSRYNKKYTRSGAQRRVKIVFAELRFPFRLSAHSLRHTYCSLLLSSGKVGIGAIRDNMGHHSIAVTNLYSHAIGDLSEIELYPSRPAEWPSETPMKGKVKSLPNIISAFLQSTPAEVRYA